MTAPVMSVPQSLTAWETMHAEIQPALWEALGTLPPLMTPDVTIVERETHANYTRETIMFDNGVDDTVRGYLLLPDVASADTPVPAMLYCHLHGNKYHLGKDELFEPVEDSGQAPGVALVNEGIAVLAIDAYGFGERQLPDIDGAAGEQWLYKHFLWRGQTLWGMILRDDLLALRYLRQHPAVDATRIGVTGMSMGGSRATWLAALSDDLAVVIPIAQMTRYRDFAAQGEYNHHGIYYYVPGMLTQPFDMEHIAALAAPAAQKILVGADDPLSPMEGVRIVAEYCENVYALYGDASFDVTIYDNVGHVYTLNMLADMIAYYLKEVHT